MGTEKQAIDTFERHLQESTRRARRQERRPSITNAADLLGPGFGPTATQVLDWNSDEATFNGFFYSPSGSLNAPDDAVEWLGVVVTDDDNLAGVQTVWSHDVADRRPREYRRRWRDDGTGVTRAYTAWVGEGTWQTSGVTGLGGWTLLGQAWRTTGDVVSLNVSVAVPFDIAVPSNGDFSPNFAALQVPAGLIPGSPYPDQAMSGGSTGRLTGWVIDGTGRVWLSAAAPGPDINSGAHISVSGTYLL